MDIEEAMELSDTTDGVEESGTTGGTRRESPPKIEKLTIDGIEVIELSSTTDIDEESEVSDTTDEDVRTPFRSPLAPFGG